MLDRRWSGSPHLHATSSNRVKPRALGPKENLRYNPWQDLWFYKDIAARNGFETVADAYIVAFAHQPIATAVLAPTALLLIVFGIGPASRSSVLSRFDRFTLRWTMTASIAAGLMPLIESDTMVYAIRYPHHIGTAAISAAYIAFIWVWCCSLSHGNRNVAE